MTRGSPEERQVYEKAQHRNKLQQRGEEPGLHLKVSATIEARINKDAGNVHSKQPRSHLIHVKPLDF